MLLSAHLVQTHAAAAASSPRSWQVPTAARPALARLGRGSRSTTRTAKRRQTMAAAFGQATEAPAAPDLKPARLQAPATNGDGRPATLLVLMPGALLTPADYDALLEAIQEQQAGAGVALWVSVPHIDWQYVSALGFSATEKWLAHSDALLVAAVQEAVAAGFPLQGKPEARMENVIVAMHSMAVAFYPSAPMKHCGAAICLASVVDGSTQTVVDAAAAPRPLMHILGQLDGQLRLPRGGWTAARLAPLAAQYGARHFARQRPFAVVPGMNHGQFSNGVVNAARGDVASDVPLSTQAAAVAGLILSFATVHAAGAAPEAARAAGDALLQATEASFELLEPFCTTSGRGSPLRALQQGAGGPAAASVASSAAYQFGAERLSPFTPDRNGHGHAGELAAAEAFARQAQEAMLRCGLDEAALQRVRIAVTVHVDINTFTYSQPTIFKADEADEGGAWVVHVHAHPKSDYYAPGMESMLAPMSPCYFLKLRKAGLVALAMGLEGEPSEAVTSAAELNQRTLEAAVAAAPALFRDTYARRGKQLRFAPDKDMSGEIKTPVDWMQAAPTFEADGERGLLMTSPLVSTPLARLPSYDSGPGRFAGAHYIKCISPAWAHEWVMIESLRRG